MLRWRARLLLLLVLDTYFFIASPRGSAMLLMIEIT